MSHSTPSYLVKVYYRRNGLLHTLSYWNGLTRCLSPKKVVDSEQNKIELDIPKEGLQLSSGWFITPDDTKIPLNLVSHGRGLVPCCTLLVKWTRPEKIPVKLCHEIKLLGARPPNNFIKLEIESPLAQTGSQSQIRFGSQSQIAQSQFRLRPLLEPHSTYNLLERKHPTPVVVSTATPLPHADRSVAGETTTEKETPPDKKRKKEQPIAKKRKKEQPIAKKRKKEQPIAKKRKKEQPIAKKRKKQPSAAKKPPSAAKKPTLTKMETTTGEK